MKTRMLLVLAICLAVATCVVSCGGDPQGSAKGTAKAFYKGMQAADFPVASQYVHNDDTTKFYEAWKTLQPKIQALGKCKIQVTSGKTRGTAMATYTKKVKKGEKAPPPLGVRLQSDGDQWWVRI